jgi:hypothetical protein
MEGTMPVKQGIQAHIETYLEKMVGVVARHPDMTQMPLAAIEGVCRVLAYGMRPEVEVLEESELHSVFRIISPPLASYVGGCLGNDTNSDLHTGEAAITQSNALIGICTDSVMRRMGGTLTVVNPLNFEKALPFEEAVLVTIIITKPGRAKILGEIEVINERTGIVIMRKAGLIMFKPRKRS